MRDKAHTIDSIALYNKAVVIPSDHRLVRLKADNGTKFTSAEVQQYYHDIGTKLELASPNNPQQIGANGRAGRTLANMMRCFLPDSGLPKFPCGELMQTAVFLSNRIPHATLADKTPYMALYGKDAYLGHLRAIGARAFVHVETHVKKLENRASKGPLAGYSMDSKSFRIFYPKTKSVRESRNVIFTKPPWSIPEPDVVSDFDERGFTYDDYDDVLRGVRSKTFNQHLSSPSPDLVIGDPCSRELLEHNRETTGRDLGISPANSIPPDESPSASPGGESPDIPAGGYTASPGGVSPSVPG